MPLYDRHQPGSWDEYVGQDRAKATARRVLDRPGFDRGAFWIDCAGANNSGVGKSTLARLMADQLADPLYITETDGARLDKAAVWDMERTAALCTAHDKRFRVWIVNEAHAMTEGAIAALLTFLERLPRHCVVIFTTTREPDAALFGDDAGPFASRCIRLRLTNQGLAQAFAERVMRIARLEGLDGRKPLAEFVKLVQRCKNNMRAALQAVEAGAMLDADGGAACAA